ncbi:tripartite motif-containing protein 2-like [Ptychodera flava]|uniref:tripartite motif-containing protein 2-like n=1 Tax=Ptychodera flava TaxID=63121 RepID=UPI003969C915
MATNDTTQTTKCPLCCMVLNDPRALSCDHHFCLSCLEQWAKVMVKLQKLACPVCAKLSSFPEEGARGFRQDQNLLALLRSSEQGKGGTNSVLNIQEVCKTHQKRLDVFCHTCDEVICSLCLGDGHKRSEHNSQQLVEFLRNKRANLTINRRVLDMNKEQIEANLRYIDELFPRLDKDRKDVGDAIAEQATLLAQRTRTDGDALLAELQRKHAQQIDHLQDTRDKWVRSLALYNDSLSKGDGLMDELSATTFVQKLQLTDLKTCQELAKDVVHPYYQHPPPTLEFTPIDFIQTFHQNSVGQVRGDVPFVPRFQYNQDFVIRVTAPTCVASFSVGELVVCGGSSLTHYAETEKTLRRSSSDIRHTTNGPLRPSQIFGIAVFKDTSAKTLFVVSDFANNQAYIVDLSGFVRKQFGKGDLNEPIGVGVCSERKIYVVSSGTHNILVYRVEGVFMNVSAVCTIGKLGNGRGEFNKPMYLAVNSKDQIIVSDYGNGRVQVLDSGGDFDFEITTAGSSPLGTPSGVAVDSRNCIYVNNNTGVQLYNSCGAYLAEVASRESVASVTYGIAVLKSSGSMKLFVTRFGSNDVVMFEETPVSRSKQQMMGRGKDNIPFSGLSKVSETSKNVSQVCAIQ